MTPDPQDPQRSTAWIGLDVGGANLKASDGRGLSHSMPFALWREPRRLPERIASLLDRFKLLDGIALTMTGELADCYASKADGVRSILQATSVAAGGKPVRVATVDDAWILPSTAEEQPLRVAAANWRVLSRWIAQQHPARNRNQSLADRSRDLVADAGSTTVDLTPIAEGAVDTESRTDTERLLAGELLYTGVRRTPVCAVTSTLPYRDAECPVAAELFATTGDAWLLLGELAPSEARDTADGRPFDQPSAVARLGRCLCADRSEFTPQDALVAARSIARVQIALVADALRRHAIGSGVVYLSGEGEFILREAAKLGAPSARLTSLAESLGENSSACGPAHAAAWLAERELNLEFHSVGEARG